jgi:hypothetical protein
MFMSSHAVKPFCPVMTPPVLIHSYIFGQLLYVNWDIVKFKLHSFLYFACITAFHIDGTCEHLQIHCVMLHFDIWNIPTGTNTSAMMQNVQVVPQY